MASSRRPVCLRLEATAMGKLFLHTPSTDRRINYTRSGFRQKSPGKEFWRIPLQTCAAYQFVVLDRLSRSHARGRVCQWCRRPRADICHTDPAVARQSLREMPRKDAHGQRSQSHEFWLGSGDHRQDQDAEQYRRAGARWRHAARGSAAAGSGGAGTCV